MAERADRPIEQIIMKERYTPEELAKVTGLDVDFINVEIHKGQLRARVIEHDIIDIARLDAIAWLRRRQGLDAT
mgnify:FL=1